MMTCIANSLKYSNRVHPRDRDLAGLEAFLNTEIDTKSVKKCNKDSLTFQVNHVINRATTRTIES